MSRDRKGNVLYAAVFVFGAMFLLWSTAPVLGDVFPDTSGDSFTANYPMSGTWDTTANATSNINDSTDTLLILNATNGPGYYLSDPFTYNGTADMSLKKLEAGAYVFDNTSAVVTIETAGSAAFNTVSGSAAYNITNTTDIDITGDITQDAYARINISLVPKTIQEFNSTDDGTTTTTSGGLTGPTYDSTTDDGGDCTDCTTFTSYNYEVHKYDA